MSFEIFAYFSMSFEIFAYFSMFLSLVGIGSLRAFSAPTISLETAESEPTFSEIYAD